MPMTRRTRLWSDGGPLRRSKYVGFLGICLGILLIVGAAVLPVSPSTERFGPFRVDLSGNACGPAAYVAYQRPGNDCRQAADKRLLAATSIGLLIVAFGMALFAGGDERHGSRVEVPTRRARAQAIRRLPRE